jgi:hypothetical protein
MGGRRTDNISSRDMDVLGFVARFGVVPRTAVETWASTGRTVTLERERRLREAGLIEVRCGVWGAGKLLLPTRAGLRASGHGDLGAARLSLASVDHESAVAALAARIERRGERTLSEREIVALERVRGDRALSAQLTARRFHRADLIVVGEDGMRDAIEVELTAKGSPRLNELLRAWRRAVAERRLQRVVYLCRPRSLRVVERAIARTRTGAAISVWELER